MTFSGPIPSLSMLHTKKAGGLGTLNQLRDAITA